MLWTDIRILIVDTGRVWWRLLPMIMGVYLLGWLGSELTSRVAVIAGDISPWLERSERILKIAPQRRQPHSFCAQILGQRLSSGVILRI